jgi:styrene-oxide isomerase
MMKRHQSLMIGHGALVLLIGLLMGFGFIFSLIGEINLWPIPGHWQFTMPGNERAWHAAHTGNILNGVMAMAAGLCLPFARLKEGAEKFVAWSFVIAIWGNVGFYVFAALGATGRGLTFGENKFGGGDVLSILNFLVGYPGAILLPIAVFVLARGALGAAREAA